MKHYLLSIQQPDGSPPPAEVLDPVMKDVGAFNDELRAAGAWVFAGGLDFLPGPGSATVLRAQEDGAVLTTDGPYAEGKEHVGGLCIIEVPDLESALEWGRKLARALRYLPVEVRPFQGETGGHLP